MWSPGVSAEFDEVPDHLKGWWIPDFWAFHSPAWWRRHWERSGLVSVEVADMVPNGWRLWADWDRLCISLPLEPLFPGDDLGVLELEALERDSGRVLGFTRVVARKL